MKKAAIASAAALLVASSSVFAGELVDEVGGEFVFNSDISGFDSGTAVAFKASKKMDDITEGFSVEAEFTKSLSGPSIDETYYYYGTIKTEVSYFTLGAFGKYTFPVNDQIALFGRAGLAYASYEATVSGGGYSGSAFDDTNIGLSYGFGASYAFSDTMSVIVGYSVYDLDTDDVSHMSVGVSMLLD